MGEIKLRVWDKESHEMLYFANPRIIYGSGQTKLVLGEHFHDDFYDGEIKEYETMWYTGLQDAKGQDIYQDDLLLHRFKMGECLYKVEMGLKNHEVEGNSFDYCGIHFVCLSSSASYVIEPGDVRTGFGFPNTDELEVVGNAYEHPELIPKEQGEQL